MKNNSNPCKVRCDLLKAVHRELAPLRCAWLGPTEHGLEWLYQRLQSPGLTRLPIQLDHLPHIDLATSQFLASSGPPGELMVDRLIIACDARVSYPWQWLDAVARSCPDLPIAVAYSSWWDGSGRTGLGSNRHFGLPWYRWWDGWVAWLAAGLQEPTDRFPATFFSPPGTLHLTDALRTATAAAHCEPRGLILANCQQSSQAIGQLANLCGQTTTSLSWQAFAKLAQQELVGASPVVPRLADRAWVLWDDSCLETSRSSPGLNTQPADYLNLIRQACPNAQLLGLTGWPRADQWLAVGDGLRVEWLVKPDRGQGLKRLLCALADCSSAALART